MSGMKRAATNVATLTEIGNGTRDIGPGGGSRALSKTMSLADYVVQFVGKIGVRHIFLVPGGGAMHLNDSLGRSSLELIFNLHEQASAICAEAYAKASGHVGAAFVTTGPGGTNAVTGVVGAWLDSTPTIFVSGQVKRADLKGDLGVRQVGVQEVDIVAMVKGVTKYAVTVMDPLMIRYHMEKATYLALNGRPGPVWVDIPLDVQAAKIDPYALPGFDPGKVASASGASRKTLEARVSETVRLLEQSERPVLLVGNGVRLAKGAAEFRTLVTQLGIPVLTTWLGLDLIPDAHPLFVGRPGAVAPRGANFAIQNSDCLISVGARLDFVLTGYSHENFAREAKKVMVDIDPTELGKMRTPIHVPVCADAREFLVELSRQWGERPCKACEPWRARCADWKAKYPVVLPEHRNRTGRSSIFALAEILSEETADGDLIVSGSSGSGIEAFLHAYRIREGQRVLHTTALGAMGFALPSAIGASLARGGVRTVVVDGDGGFQFNIQELETVARHQLPIKFFILNNNGYASIRASQKNHFGRLVGADATSGLTLPDLRKVADAYGLPTRLIADQLDLRHAVREVLALPGPVIVDTVVLAEEDRLPRISSRQTASGSMESTPLEDMFPYLEREEFKANMIVATVDDWNERQKR